MDAALKKRAAVPTARALDVHLLVPLLEHAASTGKLLTVPAAWQLLWARTSMLGDTAFHALLWQWLHAVAMEPENYFVNVWLTLMDVANIRPTALLVASRRAMFCRWVSDLPQGQSRANPDSQGKHHQRQTSEFPQGAG